jgi:hypothetical protein
MTTDNPTNPEPADDPLLAELRRLATRVDPVPDEVTAYARAALGWRRIDAELAELLVDSQLAASSTTRSVSESERTLTFRASDLDIDVELQLGEGEIVLLGQLAPAGSAEIDAQRDDGTVLTTTQSDELGRFRFSLPAGTRVRLVVRRETPAAPVETSWIDL